MTDEEMEALFDKWEAKGLDPMWAWFFTLDRCIARARKTSRAAKKYLELSEDDEVEELVEKIDKAARSMYSRRDKFKKEGRRTGLNIQALKELNAEIPATLRFFAAFNELMILIEDLENTYKPRLKLIEDEEDEEDDDE